jgi:hypothetical protein
MGDAGRRFEELQRFAAAQRTLLAQVEPTVKAMADEVLLSGWQQINSGLSSCEEYIFRLDRRIRSRSRLQDCLYVFIDAQAANRIAGSR